MLYLCVLILSDPGLPYTKLVCSLIKIKVKSILFLLFLSEVIKIPIVSSVCCVCNTVNIKIFADAEQVNTMV